MVHLNLTSIGDQFLQEPCRLGMSVVTGYKLLAESLGVFNLCKFFTAALRLLQDARHRHTSRTDF
jgi:hypothetical protein